MPSLLVEKIQLAGRTHPRARILLYQTEFITNVVESSNQSSPLEQLVTT